MMKSELYWIEEPWPGRLAIVPRPRGGDWLAEEIKAWKDAHLDVIASVLTGEEESELELRQEPELTKSSGLTFITYPMADRGVPESRKTFLAFLRRLEGELAKGRNVGVHCRQGIGRSALVAACLLSSCGLDAPEAFRRISKARGCPVPETAEQREWVTSFAKDLASSAADQS